MDSANGPARIMLEDVSRHWGVEGAARMNAGFELIWCNFSSPSARLISNLNVKVPLLSDIPMRDADLDLLGGLLALTLGS